MKPWLRQWNADLLKERLAEADEDVHFTESLAQTVIGEYTSPGDVVLDPFAGFGTTLLVAERMGRQAVGVELLPERVEAIRGRLGGRGTVIHGDARELEQLVPGAVDLCLTSPPYMSKVVHRANPLNGYRTDDGHYSTYLAELGDVFAQVARLLRPGGHLVVNVANMTDEGIVTTLAWDVGKLVSQHLTLVQETFVCWDTQPEWLTGDYCLIFRRL